MNEIFFVQFGDLKEYLFNNLKDVKIWTELQFWINLCNFLIEKKNEENSKNKKTQSIEDLVRLLQYKIGY